MPASISHSQPHSATSSLPTFSTLGRATAGVAFIFAISTLSQAQAVTDLAAPATNPLEPFCPLGMIPRSNSTLAPHLQSTRFASAEVSAYLKTGDIVVLKASAKEIRANKFKQEHPPSEVWYQRHNQDVGKEHADLAQKAVEEYLQQLEQVSSPMDRAMLLSYARSVLQTGINTLFDRRYDIPRGGHRAISFVEQAEELRYQEALACSEAAAMATNPYDKLAWLQRAAAELKPTLEQAKGSTGTIAYGHGYKEDHSTFNTQCDLGSRIWSEMGALLLKPPFDNALECPLRVKGVFGDFDREVFLPEEGSAMPQQFLAAVCFHNAAQMTQGPVRMRSSKDEHIGSLQRAKLQEAIDFYSKSIVLMQGIDLPSSKLTPYQKAILQNDIQYSCYLRWHAQRNLDPKSKKMKEYGNAAFIEKLKTVESWDLVLQQPDLYPYEKREYLVKKAHLLSSASGFAPSLKRASELAAQALAAVQAAWDLIPAALRNRGGEASEEFAIRTLLKAQEAHAREARQLHVAEVMRKKTAQINSWIPGILRPLVRIITGR